MKINPKIQCRSQEFRNAGNKKYNLLDCCFAFLKHSLLSCFPTFLRGILVFLCLCSLSLLAQNGDPNDPKIITEKWLQIIDAGKYIESHDTTSLQVRTLVNPKNWANAIASTRSPLGKMISRKVLSMQPMDQLPDGSRGTYMVVQLLTQFQANTRAIETVTLVMDPDGQWRPGGYYIKKIRATS